MFNNIGNKIKTLAKVACWLGIILSTLFGLYFSTVLAKKSILGGIVLFFIYSIIGSLLSWIGSFILYGFGELIANAKSILNNQNDILNLLESASSNEQKIIKNNNKWHCQKCGLEINEEYDKCPFCDFIEKRERLKEENNTKKDG